MLRKGDICIYLPSGREVTVVSDQHSGTRVGVRDLSKQPSPILDVPPTDVRRIREGDEEAQERVPVSVRPSTGKWSQPEQPEPWESDVRRCEDPACPIPHPHCYHGGRIS